MGIRSTLVVALAALALSAPGCAGRSRLGVPVMGPIALETEQARRGQILFMRYCHQCHPGGSAGLGPALNSYPVVDAVYHAQVRLGLGVMPRFSEEELPDEALEAIIAYVREMQDG